jgi:stage II sporulation protein D
MSQWGAYGMARRGDSYAAILQHYYRGTRITPYGQLVGAVAAAPGSTGVQASAADAQVVATASPPQP